MNDCVTSANISPNTELIAFANENSSICLYKLNETKLRTTKSEDYIETSKINPNENQENFQELTGGHSGTVFKAKFTHDSKYLLSCGSDNIACLWNVNKSISNSSIEEVEEDEDDSFKANSSLISSYSGHLYPVWDVEIFSQLNLFATSSKDCTARLWSFDRLYPLRIYCGHQSDVNCVQFHPNGSYIATGSSDKTVRLWSVQTGEFVRLFSGHRSRVFSVCFSPDGNYLASAGEDKKIKLWDLRTSLMLKEFKGHSDIIHSLTFDNQSEVLLSGGLDKTLKLWDVHSKNIKIPGMESGSLKGSPNSNNSTELIRSINLEFNVYSIYCDIQNVFYVNGAKKMSNNPVSSPLINKGGVINEEIIKKDTKVMKIDKGIKLESDSNVSGQKVKKIVPEPSNQETKNSTPLVKSTINTRRRTAQTSNNPQIAPPVHSSFFFNTTDDDLYEV